MARLLKKQRGMLPRPLMLLLANVRAAEAGVRFLPTGADWNRVWGGDTSAPTMAFARTALDEFRRAKIWAALDLHNNTGSNPLYAAVFRNARRAASLQLAAGFSGVVVETEMPRGTCMEALSGIAPAATLECGMSGSPEGIARATEFIAEILERESLPQDLPQQTLRTIAKVHLPPRHSVTFGGASPQADIAIPAAVERWNFQELKDGFVFAHLRKGVPASARLAVFDSSGADVFGHYFAVQDDKICTARPFIPAMLAANEKAARGRLPVLHHAGALTCSPLPALAYLHLAHNLPGSRVPGATRQPHGLPIRAARAWLTPIDGHPFGLLQYRQHDGM